MTHYTKVINMFERTAVLSCDGKCQKAWGLNNRPKIELDPADDDDFAYFADHELGDAPANPGTYEGRDAKPPNPENMNKWCARECERSSLTDPGQPLPPVEFYGRVYNLPTRHQGQS